MQQSFPTNMKMFASLVLIINNILPHIVPLKVKPSIQSHIVPLHSALSSIHVGTVVVHDSPIRVPSYEEKIYNL